jgi:DNA primase
VTSENPPLRFALRYIDDTHPYLTSRRVSRETIRTFGTGLYTGNGLLRGRIVIPIHNASGELIAYAGRAIDGQEPKHLFPVGFRKSLVLFNLHRVIATKPRTTVVVEGFFDTMLVHEAGYPVIGLMGSALSRHQVERLVSHFDHAVLMLDGDDAGRLGTAAIHAALTSRIAVTTISLDSGSQPDQLSIERLRTVITVKSDCIIETQLELKREHEADHFAPARGHQP